MVTNTADWGAAMVSGQMVELVKGELPVSCEPKLYQKPSLFPLKWKSIFTDHFFTDHFFTDHFFTDHFFTDHFFTDHFFTDHFFTDHFFTIIFPYWFIAWSGLCEII